MRSCTASSSVSARVALVAVMIGLVKPNAALFLPLCTAQHSTHAAPPGVAHTPLPCCLLCHDRTPPLLLPQANHLEVGPLVTLSHVAPFAMAALSLPAVLFEGPRLLDEYEKWSGAVPMVLLSGLLASILNLVVFKIIRLTSALTTSLSGVLKEWACILVAMWVYGTQVSESSSGDDCRHVSRGCQQIVCNCWQC